MQHIHRASDVVNTKFIRPGGSARRSRAEIISQRVSCDLAAGINAIDAVWPVGKISIWFGKMPGSMDKTCQ